MLDPHDRTLLSEALRPPPDHEVSWVVGTTFTLDLVALLTTPLTFALFDQLTDDEDGQVSALPLLEALRRYADRMTIFCETGRIKVPRPDQQLFAFLEGCVIQARAPLGGLFHPKVWLIRYEGEGVIYRLVCLSRNLTMDRSWDVALVLEGVLRERKNAFGHNRPLSEFIAALPGMAVHPLPTQTASELERIRDEVLRVDWEVPEPFEAVRFWPAGHRAGRPWPFKGQIDRMLVMSPFLGHRALSRLTQDGGRHVLVSRTEELDRMPRAAFAGFERIRAFNDAADLDALSAGEVETDEHILQGLHAKLYVAEGGDDSSVWVGSANATMPAFRDNVEFLVELIGPRPRTGIRALLREEQEPTVPTFASLLLEYEPSDPVEEERDETGALALIEAVRATLSAASFGAVVESTEDSFRVGLTADRALDIPANTTVTCWPIRLHEGSGAVGITEGPGEIARWVVDEDSLTSFFAFHVTAKVGETIKEDRFAINAPLEGAPADRHQRILRSILRDRNRLLRFLLFLLVDGDPEAILGLTTQQIGPDADRTDGAVGMELPLFESMVRALSRDPPGSIT